ncbi:MAG TPA: hypothetical protein VJ377_07110 [Dehalococcoidales bacterium]|nr:hypothetical protein [Dehalococcoidales bacterium]
MNMNKKLLLIIITAVILLSLVLAGCQAGTGGIPQELYDQVNAALKEAQSKYAEVQGKAGNLEAEKSAMESQLKAAQAQVAELQKQVGSLSLTGATPAETAEKIVRNYHETHVYSTWDLFICSDMSSEIWNILKAAGINSVVAVGDIDTAVSDIVLSDHAWVLAEVAPGQYLALETTGGFVVPKTKNPLYYRGWTFDSPATLKSYNQLIREYNVRVGIRNQINDEANKVVDEHNKATNQSTADRLEAVYNKLVELRGQQEAELNRIKAEITGLAKVL